MTIAENPVAQDEAFGLADTALQICGALKGALDDAQWQVPLLAVEQPRSGMALATTLVQTKRRLSSTRAAIEQWQRTGQNTTRDQGVTFVSAFEAKRETIIQRFLIVQEYERQDLLDRAKKAGIPFQHCPVEPAKPSRAPVPEPAPAPLLIHGTDEQRKEAQSLSALLASTAAEVCLELSCVAVSRTSKSFRSSCDLVVYWLELAATLLNDMKGIPVGSTTPGIAREDDETLRLRKIRAQWDEFEQKVRAAEREQKNRLKARSIDQ